MTKYYLQPQKGGGSRVWKYKQKKQLWFRGQVNKMINTACITYFALFKGKFYQTRNVYFQLFKAALNDNNIIKTILNSMLLMLMLLARCFNCSFGNR